MKLAIILFTMLLFSSLVYGQEITLDDKTLDQKQIKPGQTDKYNLKLSKNTCFHVKVKEYGIDLKLEIFSADGTLVNYSNGSTNINSYEEINDCLDAGSYTLAVSSVESNAPFGHYTLESTTISTTAKEQYTNARQLFIQAKQLDELEKEGKLIVNTYLKSAVIYSSLGEIRRSADIIAILGDKYLRENDLDSAIFYYSQSLDLYEKIADYYGKSNLLNNLGYVYKLKNDYKKSLEYYEQTISICKEILNDDYEEAFTTYNLGALFEAQNKPDMALNYYTCAINVLEKKGFSNLCGYLSRKVVGIYKRNNNYQKTLEIYDLQVEYFSNAKNIKEAAIVLSDKADFLKEIWDKENALKAYENSYVLFEEIGDKNSQATELNNIGSLYDLYGETYKAIEKYKKALTLCEENNKYLKALILNNLGLSLSSTRDYEEAFLNFYQSLSISQSIENDENFLFQTGVIQSNVASTYADIGNYTTAKEYNYNALEIFKKLKREYNEGITLSNLGSIYLALSDFPNARDCFASALKILKKAGAKRSQAVVMTKVADLEIKNQKYTEALSLLTEALELRRQTNDQIGEVYTLNLLGFVHFATNQKASALDIFTRALKISDSFFDQRAKMITIYNLASIAKENNNLGEALNWLELGINIVESTILGIKTKSFQSTFFADNQRFYELYISTLMEMHKQNPNAGYDIKGLMVSEISRARNFLDTSTNTQKARYLNVDLMTLKRYEELQNQLDFLGQQIIKLKALKVTEQQTHNLEESFRSVKIEVEVLEGKVNNRRNNFKVLNLQQIQNLIEKNDILVEYMLSDKANYVWTVTKDAFHSYQLPAKDLIETASKNLYENLTERNKTVKYENKTQKYRRLQLADSLYSEKAKVLSSMILPFEEQLEKRRILVSTIGELNVIPFATLMKKNGKPIIVDHEIISVPSISTTQLIDERNKQLLVNPENEILVFADPVFGNDDERITKSKSISNNSKNELPQIALRELRDGEIERLPSSKREAAFISTVYGKGAKILTDSRATKDNFLHFANNFKSIHIATHAFQDTTYPDLNCVVLSLVDPNGNSLQGFLTVNEIKQLNVGAGLVVLSACQTSLGKEVKGAGVVGLSSAFLQSGANQVISSLWSVSDSATADLMIDLYKSIKNGMSPSAALRAAQLNALKNPKTCSPYFWGAFQIGGNINERK